MKKIIIVGSGIAGVTAAENIRKINRDVEISIITDEKFYPYSRIKLSKYICRPFNIEELYLHKGDWYKEQNIKVVLSRELNKIIPEENSIVLSSGEKITYDKLILANGSSSFVPPIRGNELNGVFTVRKAEDINKINNYINEMKVKNVTVIGGGLLGIEAAWSIRENSNININIIEALPRLLPRQLDEEGSQILENIVNENNITLYKAYGVKEISGNSHVEKVILENGNEVISDLVIISAGVRSNIKAALDSKINANRGIIVDDRMRTNYDNIYAAGDVAEFSGNVWGIWPVAMEQGKVAGINSAGIEAHYNEITPSNLLQVMGVSVFSAGTINDKDAQAVKYDGIYSKLFFKEGLIIGGIVMGDTKKGFKIKTAIEQRRNFSKELLNNVDIMKII
ncbi:MAG TPA: NAD(P)/FAD-dependent oxidoreductase [Clostridiaceae bacterium]|nr:NAD(P)/FAD-dependent oxidoreductase [Clostridiaceae bacterium]HBF76517.1 NAD(P)/FAD-dependent oxidoreductase [Clostridiaceae bacterium]HBG38672.1 NAD(P)/FAD-dependent oxidoreductase [Clostridiaceae bacterium]HBN28417.1 NAD(P)/FAD-dependent oxidoreductase [Clostridiaceae bacterium]HBX48483.1 NAD(P)/FAD-dependent oxidoreductase [Clostridiaceae bacterium]